MEKTPDKQLDLLIVVDQMLTGFDSKWINTLYLDKMLVYENIIQAFSRTNRLFGPGKAFRPDPVLPQAPYDEAKYRSSGEAVLRG